MIDIEQSHRVASRGEWLKNIETTSTLDNSSHDSRTADSLPVDTTALGIEKRLLKLVDVADSVEQARLARELYSDARSAGRLPLIIDNRVYFMFYGRAEKVSLLGDWTYWQVASQLNRVDNTDLRYCVLDFPRTARLQYKFIVDDDFRLDEGNPRSSVEGFGVNSEFMMPLYRDDSWLEPPALPIERGEISRASVDSSRLGETREILLYTPHRAADQRGALPVIMIHDGAEAVHIGRFHLILDHLIAAGRIPPVAAIFVPPKFRNDEYALNQDYVLFTVEEVLPQAEKVWKDRGVTISAVPHERAVLGASLGGLLATDTAFQFPETFGTFIAQSPAYWWKRGEILRSGGLRHAPKLRAILQTGTICDARELTRMMYQKLKGLGGSPAYMEYEQGHTWGNWRTNLAAAIQQWLPNTRD